VSTYFARIETRPLRPVNKTTLTSNGASVNGARMAGEDRRLQILRIAMRLFSQCGFRGTTTKEIAVAAGVSEAMVFRHFATKEELYSAILDHKACLHDAMDPLQKVAQAIERKDDRAVFEGIALDALSRHDCDPEFQRLLLHSALEQHELAHMFWEKFVRRVYRSLGNYIRERQREGAIVDIQPAVVVRAFIGMVMHHSLNNNLWDRKRSLLNISNKTAAREFANILLHGVSRADDSSARSSLSKSKSTRAAVVRVATSPATAPRSNAAQRPKEKSNRKRSSR
jgi:AcrR family transcriptional regulator